MDFIKNNKLATLLCGMCIVFVVLLSSQDSKVLNNVERQEVALLNKENESSVVLKEKEETRLDKRQDKKAVGDLANADNSMLKEISYKQNSKNKKRKIDASRLSTPQVTARDINTDDLMERGSKKLLRDANDDMLLGLANGEDSEAIAKRVVKREYVKNFTPKGYSEYEVVSGDTLTGIWFKNGGTRESSLEAEKAFKKANVSMNSLKVGEILNVYKRRGRIRKIEKKMPLGKKVTLTLNKDGSYNAFVYAPKIVEKDRIVTGKISSSFVAEAHKLGVPNDVIDQYVDLFSSKVSFKKSLQKGDVFSIKYKEKRTKEDGTYLSAGDIQSASIVNQGKFVILVGYKGASGKMNYYDENGEAGGNYMLRYPLNFTRISSVFTKERFHPILKRNRPHNGVDFAAPMGTPVRSVADGVVTFAGWMGGGGKTIKIKHSGKYRTAYLHLSKIASGIKVGAHVSRGQNIGNVGSTGLSTGPHLHYSFYINNVYVDPLKVDLPSMPIGGDSIPKAYLKNAIAELKATTKEMMASNTDEHPEA